jgi:hypothetical protein
MHEYPVLLIAHQFLPITCVELLDSVPFLTTASCLSVIQKGRTLVLSYVLILASKVAYIVLARLV